MGEQPTARTWGQVIVQFSNTGKGPTENPGTRIC
jgi:hypothetical protein